MRAERTSVLPDPKLEIGYRIELTMPEAYLLHAVLREEHVDPEVAVFSADLRETIDRAFVVGTRPPK